jgi:HNH endonuclease
LRTLCDGFFVRRAAFLRRTILVWCDRERPGLTTSRLAGVHALKPKGQSSSFWGRCSRRESRRGRRIRNFPTATGCWHWRLATNKGYGVVRILGVLRKAHVVMYERAKGPVPEGHQLHHVCRNRDCVNPDHLLALTATEHRQLHDAERRAA